MTRRITISRLMIAVAVEAIDSLLAKSLARLGDIKYTVIFACVVFSDAAILLVFVTFRKIMRQKPGDRATGAAGCMLLLVVLILPSLLLTLLVVLDEILGHK